MPGPNDYNSQQPPPAPQQTLDSPSGTPNPTLSMDSGTPSPERNQYSNKESGKVNSGLDFGFGLSDSTATHTSSAASEAPDTQKAFYSNAPAVAIDLSLLCPPSVVLEPQPSLEKIVHTLLHPPLHAFVHGTLSLQWVIGAVGYTHFMFRDSDERWVLRADSGLRERGREAGIPGCLWEWLAGGELGEVGKGASELGIVLTRGFFEGVVREGGR